MTTSLPPDARYKFSQNGRLAIALLNLSFRMAEILFRIQRPSGVMRFSGVNKVLHLFCFTFFKNYMSFSVIFCKIYNFPILRINQMHQQKQNVCATQIYKEFVEILGSSPPAQYFRLFLPSLLVLYISKQSIASRQQLNLKLYREIKGAWKVLLLGALCCFDLWSQYLPHNLLQMTINTSQCFSPNSQKFCPNTKKSIFLHQFCFLFAWKCVFCRGGHEQSCIMKEFSINKIEGQNQARYGTTRHYFSSNFKFLSFSLQKISKIPKMASCGKIQFTT